MPASRSNAGPWFHRFLVRFFAVVLTALAYWSLGFLLDDIGSWPAPEYAPYGKGVVDPKLLSDLSAAQRRVEVAQRDASVAEQQQRLIRNSTDISQTTLQQLLSLQRLTLEKGVKPLPEEQQALAEAQTMFLSNQKQDQQLAQKLIQLQSERQAATKDMERLSGQLATALIPAQTKYHAALRRHTLLIGLAKLAVFVPLMLAALWAFVKYRNGLYAPLVYAGGIAVMAKLILILHGYFPMEYFKYLWMAAAIGVVIWILVSLLRRMAKPAQDWLLKQYREAYECFLCPMCEYPIRRGPLKYLSWTRRSIRKLQLSANAPHGPDEPYTCPHCSTSLFEECPTCHGIRHSLLPACEHCGTNKPPTESDPARST